MGRPFSKHTKYPRKKPKPKIPRPRKSARKANTHALARALRGEPQTSPQSLDPPSPSAIRAFRQLLGFTQVGFADQLGTSGLVVSYWERGRQAPGPKFTARLKELADMNNLDLVLVEDPDYRRERLEIRVFVEKEISA